MRIGQVSLHWRWALAAWTRSQAANFRTSQQKRNVHLSGQQVWKVSKTPCRTVKPTQAYERLQRWRQVNAEIASNGTQRNKETNTVLVLLGFACQKQTVRKIICKMSTFPITTLACFDIDWSLRCTIPFLWRVSTSCAWWFSLENSSAQPSLACRDEAPTSTETTLSNVWSGTILHQLFETGLLTPLTPTRIFHNTWGGPQQLYFLFYSPIWSSNIT
jgi:hypothetical protein